MGGAALTSANRRGQGQTPANNLNRPDKRRCKLESDRLPPLFIVSFQFAPTAPGYRSATANFLSVTPQLPRRYPQLSSGFSQCSPSSAELPPGCGPGFASYCRAAPRCRPSYRPAPPTVAQPPLRCLPVTAQLRRIYRPSTVQLPPAIPPRTIRRSQIDERSAKSPSTCAITCVSHRYCPAIAKFLPNGRPATGQFPFSYGPATAQLLTTGCGVCPITAQRSRC